MPVGFQILPRGRAVSPEQVARARKLPVANVSDCMARIVAGGHRLRPMHDAKAGGGGMAGAALTVKAAPGDNLMLHKAIQLARAGDVVVLDAGGDLTNAIMGELMLAQFTRKNVAGIVINGAIRDAGYIRAQGVPVFAAGVTHRGPYKNGPGEINVPIALDGMVIEPGDLVLGDEDGILAVPFDAVDGVLAAAEKKLAAETRQMADIQAGTYDAAWVDEALRRLGCSGV